MDECAELPPAFSGGHLVSHVWRHGAWDGWQGWWEDGPARS